MPHFERIRHLRELMRQKNINAYYVGMNDPHQSIHIVDHWKAIKWLIGFTGSSGFAVITEDKIAFWTDGRYVIQSSHELAPIKAECINTDDLRALSVSQWILANIPAGGTLGLDGRTLSIQDFKEMGIALQNAGISIKHTHDLIGEIWQDRPPIPSEPFFELDIAFTGEPREKKLHRVREAMRNIDVDFTLVSAMDDVAWLTNLRCFEHAQHPIFHSYALIGMEKAYIFLNPETMPNAIKEKLHQDGWQICLLHDATKVLSSLQPHSVIYCDPHRTGFLLWEAIPAEVKRIEGLDLVTAMKAVRNPVEQMNIHHSQVKESICFVRLIKHLKENINRIPMTEMSIVDFMYEEHRKADTFLREANVPSVGYMQNAAMPHYKPTRAKHVTLKPEGFVLFDLCAHYKDGTTDITRTITLGSISNEMKKDYTLCLKAHIALATQKFPFGCTGPILDGIAKAQHWNHGITYGHGTGHGEGFASEIHEGPCKISISPAHAFAYMYTEPLRAGMVFSNEPGLYKPKRYGIRLENSIIVREAFTNEFGTFLEFETLTHCPFELDAIDPAMLNENEKKWLNDYHKKTYEILAKELDSEERAFLAKLTRPL